MSDERAMIPSEATTAGCVAQSLENQLRAALAREARLRQERETLAEAIRGYETCRGVLMDLFADSFIRAGIERAYDLAGESRRAALALLDGEKDGDRPNPYAAVVEAAIRWKAARDENAIAWTPESVQVVDEAADELYGAVANLTGQKDGASCDS